MVVANVQKKKSNFTRSMLNAQTAMRSPGKIFREKQRGGLRTC
jgi:hypothetical protein